MFQRAQSWSGRREQHSGLIAIVSSSVRQSTVLFPAMQQKITSSFQKTAFPLKKQAKALFPIGSMGLEYLPTFGLNGMVNVGKYFIHEAFGVVEMENPLQCQEVQVNQTACHIESGSDPWIILSCWMHGLTHGLACSKIVKPTMYFLCRQNTLRTIWSQVTGRD